MIGLFKSIKQCFCEHDFEEKIVAVQKKFYDSIVLHDLYGKLAPPALAGGYIIADRVETTCKKCGMLQIKYRNIKERGVDPTSEETHERKMEKFHKEMIEAINNIGTKP